MALDEPDLDQDTSVGDYELARLNCYGCGEKDADGYNQKQPRPVDATPRSEHGDGHDDDKAKDGADYRAAQCDPMNVSLVKRTFIRLQGRCGVSAPMLLRLCRRPRIILDELLKRRERRPFVRALSARGIRRRNGSNAEAASNFVLGVRAQLAAIVANEEFHVRP